MNLEERLQAALDWQETYQATDAERAKILGVTMLACVGGVAVGKNYLMHESGFFITGTETSRQPRRGDDLKKYTYEPNEVMLEAITNREYIQYGVHMPDLIYATRASHYQSDTTNIKDIWFNAVEPLKNKGFKAVKAVSVLVPGEQWRDYLDDRFYDRPFEYALDRILETERSLKWSMDQHLSGAADHLLIINDATQTDGNLARIAAFANGERVEPLSVETAVQVADQMRAIIQEYKNKEPS
jgi:hypothetical protein